MCAADFTTADQGLPDSGGDKTGGDETGGGGAGASETGREHLRARRSSEVGAGLLCEVCGYPLVADSVAGLERQSAEQEAVCPECGEPIRRSLPATRTGLPWQRRPGLGAWVATAGAVLLRPRRSFRKMHLGGSNGGARLFLLINVCLVGGITTATAMWGHGRGLLVAWLLGMAAAKATLVLTYIEALGVTLFSRRRRWRVPFALAERIAGYASAGWIVTAALLGAGSLGFDRVVSWSLTQLRGQLATPLVDLLAGMLLFGAAVLCFELLVWTGVRQCRFGNRPAGPSTHQGHARR